MLMSTLRGGWKLHNLPKSPTAGAAAAGRGTGFQPRPSGTTASQPHSPTAALLDKVMRHGKIKPKG